MLMANEELKQTICERIANGETQLKLEKEHGFPSRMTVFRWRNDDPKFDVTITRAYQSAGSALADEVIELSRETKGKDSNVASANRTAIDGLKWAASKFYPKMFGDHAQTSVNVAVDARTVVVTEDKRKELQAKLKAIQDAQTS